VRTVNCARLVLVDDAAVVAGVVLWSVVVLLLRDFAADEGGEIVYFVTTRVCEAR
jgi:hypothetical protein